MSESNRPEKWYLVRYLGAGMINTATGFGTIALLTALNFNPLVSNSIGFAVGMLFSFTLAKFFVFKRSKNTESQVKRYAISFVIAYGLNFIVLAISKNHMSNAIAQAMAVATYVAVMYLLMRCYIFASNS